MVSSSADDDDDKGNIIPTTTMEQTGGDTNWDDDKLSGQFTKLNVDAPVFVPSFMPASGGGGGGQTQPSPTIVQVSELVGA